jgi:hypothetical protein
MVDVLVHFSRYNYRGNNTYQLWRIMRVTAYAFRHDEGWGWGCECEIEIKRHPRNGKLIEKNTRVFTLISFFFAHNTYKPNVDCLCMLFMIKYSWKVATYWPETQETHSGVQIFRSKKKFTKVQSSRLFQRETNNIIRLIHIQNVNLLQLCSFFLHYRRISIVAQKVISIIRYAKWNMDFDFTKKIIINIFYWEF